MVAGGDAATLQEVGRLVPLEEQDRSRWERPLIEQGVRILERSAQGERVSAYHLEAGIAALHCLAASHEETDWTEIIALYDLLYGLTPTPIVALNRAIAIGQAEGPGKALEELNRIPGARKLKDYPFYPAAGPQPLRIPLSRTQAGSLRLSVPAAPGARRRAAKWVLISISCVKLRIRSGFTPSQAGCTKTCTA